MSDQKLMACRAKRCNTTNIVQYNKELKKHRDKCKSFFDEIQNGERLYIKAERVVEDRYDEIRSDEIRYDEMHVEDMRFVRLSLLTEKIINYDLEMFEYDNRVELLSNYRPFFISFIVPFEDDKIKDIELLESDWHEGQFIHNKSEVPREDNILLNGILETSASPVNYLDGRLLVFTNKKMKKSVLEKINSTYDPRIFKCTCNSDVEKILNAAWSGDCPSTIDIYNVGHGNADYIRGFKGKKILYDIGYNYRSFPSYKNSKYLRAVYAMRHLKPSCVILSHWDMDHIIGCAYGKQDLFNVKWIAPYLVSKNDKYASPNSIRLAHYLKNLDNLCLVNRDQTNKQIATIFCSNDTKILMRLGSGSSILTPKNREGLTLEIIDENIDENEKRPHILLAGDVPYKCMSNSLKDTIDFLHVPHHCSKMELDKLEQMPGKGKCAIISTNRTKKGIPNRNDEHYNILVNKFKVVINTIDDPDGDDDEANLSVQINYSNGTIRFRKKLTLGNNTLGSVDIPIQ